MLQLDLEAFGQAAGWERLPANITSCNFHLTASDPAFPGAVLPAATSDGQVYWYAAAETGSEWRQLQPLLMAYVGPTVTGFSGRIIVPDRMVPAERMLQDRGVHAIATLIPGEGCLPLATTALDRLRRALGQRPTATRSVPETTASILAQLDMSLAAGARTEAMRLLGRLRVELRLDTLNLHFLEVRILAVFRAWREMIEADWFSELSLVRKPAAVAGAMLEALWHVHLEPVATDTGRLNERYRQDVQLLARLLLAQAPSVSGGVIERLRKLESPPPAMPETEAGRAQELLDQAAEAPSHARVTQARVAIDALPEQARQTLLESAAGQQALTELGSLEGPLPTDWLSWLCALNDPRFATAAAVAREGVEAWPAEGLVNAAQVRSISEKLLEIGLTGGLARDRLVESLPSMVRWVKGDPLYPRGALAIIYEALLQLFALLERRDGPTREAAADLLDAILTVGVAAVDYRQLLADYSGFIDEGAGQSSVYWLIDVAAILLDHPAPDSAARLLVLNRALSSLQPLLGRLTPGQRAAYDRIAIGASWPPLPAPLGSPSESALERLDHKSIAIYTLTESAGRQAEAVLRAMVPTVHVDLAHDHVASPRLVRLARDADLFVLTAASAKHAATDCIVEHRGKKPLLHAAGRGFSSIVRAIEDYVDGGEVNAA